MSRNARNLTVVHVVLSLDAGGLERVVLDLAREGRQRGQSVAILCIEKPGALSGETDASELYSVNKGEGLRPAVLGRVRQILKQLQPDVIHTHQVPALLYVAAALRRRRPVLVHTEHNNQLARFLTWRERASYLLWLALGSRRVDRFFGVSADSSAGLLHTRLIQPEKIFTVINGIHLSRFQTFHASQEVRRTLGIADSAFVLGTIGRLNEMKRQDILLDVFAKFLPTTPSAQLVLVGDGPMRGGLQRQAVDLGIASQTVFAGYQSQPERFLPAMDVFVQTSRMEGLPLAILEAAAAGVPVVAAKVGGVEEVSDEGRSMLLYNFDDRATLRRLLQNLAGDTLYRKTIASAGQLHVSRHYSAEKMAENYENHYRELLA